MERETYFDKQDENGNLIAGAACHHSSVAADDTYVYLYSPDKLIRVHQITKKMEAMSDALFTDTWQYILYNPVDKMLYIVNSGQARIYRVDPYHTPEGRTTPWITVNDLEWVIGDGRGSVREGNGRKMRFGGTETVGMDVYGNMYLCDSPNQVVWKIDIQYNATVVGGIPGISGYIDGDPTIARFRTPMGVAATNDGRIYVADAGNNLIRCIAVQ